MFLAVFDPEMFCHDSRTLINSVTYNEEKHWRYWTNWDRLKSYLRNVDINDFVFTIWRLQWFIYATTIPVFAECWSRFNAGHEVNGKRTHGVI